MDKHEEHSGHHVTPFSVYYRVWGTLLVLTIVTVVTSYMDFGYGNMLIALAIATTKALLVILFFMGLKYEGQENNVTFFMSFVFLSIFISLTISDLLYRTPTEPVKVDASGMMAAAPPVDAKKFIQPTPELLAKGKTLFQQQCITCHGGEGKGDGAAAAALNPKPRNFTSAEGWKFGRTVTGLFKTITDGSPGTAMPPFSGLSPEERFAVAHYVRTFMPNAPSDTPAEIAALESASGKPPKQVISIAAAMEKMAEPEAAVSHPGVADVGAAAVGRGATIYKENCMACHGAGGEGGKIVQSIGVNPPLQFRTRPLEASSEPAFVRTVSEGIPGVAMPGFASFTSGEWRDLYEYVRSLGRR